MLIYSFLTVFFLFFRFELVYFADKLCSLHRTFGLQFYSRVSDYADIVQMRAVWSFVNGNYSAYSEVELIMVKFRICFMKYDKDTAIDI